MIQINIPKTLLLTSLVLCGFVINTTQAQTQFYGVSDNQIPYFAMLKGNSDRSMIVYNPTFCREMPGPCRFFIKHNQAHRQLNHLILPPTSYSPLTEAVADCYAANNGDAQDVFDTYKLLTQPDKASKYSIPGDLQLRAEKIKACAIKAENWVGKF
ncbi:MAG: hypothetical protein AB8D52_01055 [Gammaproteobacteria bacterium]